MPALAAVVGGSYQLFASPLGAEPDRSEGGEPSPGVPAYSLIACKHPVIRMRSGVLFAPAVDYSPSHVA